jgi:diacylglycerol kinase family enzyme
MISPSADIKDGLIDFVIVREFPKWKILFFLYSFLKSKVHLSKYTEIIKAKEIKIHSESGLIHLDGESINCDIPIHIKVNEGSLKIFPPQ